MTGTLKAAYIQNPASSDRNISILANNDIVLANNIVVANTTSTGNVTANIITVNTFTANTVNITNANISGNLTVTGTASIVPSSSFLRNRIINGDMRIDQRLSAAGVTPSTAQYLVDRWAYTASQSSKFTAQQNAGSVTPPVGFSNYLGFQSQSAYSVLASDYFMAYQAIEGLNIADLAWGTANAKTVTLSFQVYSSLTGTFGGSIANNAATRTYPFSYTVSSANTWTSVSVTIPGDTTGTWLTGALVGIVVRFGLGAGSNYVSSSGAWIGANAVQPTGTVSVVGTNGATFYITGVQFEVGTLATPFERRQYGQELMLCQRYYHRVNAPAVGNILALNGICQSTTSAIIVTNFPVIMRSAPLGLDQSGTASHYNLYISSNVLCSAVPAFSASTVWYSALTATVASGLATNAPVWLTAANTAAYLAWSAEL